MRARFLHCGARHLLLVAEAALRPRSRRSDAAGPCERASAVRCVRRGVGVPDQQRALVE
jgi:hypothetical protein